MDEQTKRDFTDKIIDFIFSKDPKKYVILLFLIGFIIRLILSMRIPVYADEMVYTSHSIGFIDSGKLQTFNEDGVWFFLTNLFMNILGTNVLGSRFLSVFLGSLSIIIVYLIGKEIFNERVGLIASAILAISSYHIITSVALMDIPMFFFVFLGVYLLILSWKYEKNSYFLWGWISIGVSIMVKQTAVLFIPALFLFHLFYNKKSYKKLKIKQLFYATIILILLISPILTFNYLLYKDKKVVDMQFSRFFGLAKEQYASIANTLPGFSFHSLFVSYAEGNPSGIFMATSFLYTFESWIILLLSVLGIFIIFLSKNNFKWLLFLSFLIPFTFLAGTSLLPNHFVFCAIFFALFSAKAIDWMIDIDPIKKHKVLAISIIFLLILTGSLVQINQEAHGFFGKNEIAKMIDFKNKNIETNSLVIVDTRIYTGRLEFMFWDRHYLDATLFPSLMQNIDSFPGEAQPIPTYFIEAVTDDSGWGTIKNQPELNQSIEGIVSFFKNSTELIGTVTDIKDQKHFNVYKQIFMIKESTFESIDSTHEFFFYPLGYKPSSKVFDNYDTYNSLDSLSDKFAHLIFYTEIILALILSLLSFYLLFKTPNKSQILEHKPS